MPEQVNEQESKNHQAFAKLAEAMLYLREAKPTEKSEVARRYAVTITDLEKVVAYFQVYVVEDDEG